MGITPPNVNTGISNNGFNANNSNVSSSCSFKKFIRASLSFTISLRSPKIPFISTFIFFSISIPESTGSFILLYFSVILICKTIITKHLNIPILRNIIVVKMKSKIIVVLVIAGMVLGCSALSEKIISKELIFERAVVNIEIEEDYVHITGEFFLKNYSDESSFIIGYPLHIDEYMAPPSSVEVFLDNNKINYKKVDQGDIIFKVDIGKFERKIVKIDSYQKLNRKDEFKVTYITRSIKTWRKPLKNEKFIIKIPKEYTVKEISFPVREIKEQNEFLIYYIDMDNLYPDIDLVLYLEIKDSKRGENV